jgi:predicted RNA methylase
LLYKDKDYPRSGFIETLRNIKWKSKTILDMGCGTGGHALACRERL